MGDTRQLQIQTRLDLTRDAIADALAALGLLHTLLDAQEILDAGAALSTARDAVNMLELRLTERQVNP